MNCQLECLCKLQKRKRHETSDTQNHLIYISDRYYIHIRSSLRLWTTLNKKKIFLISGNRFRNLLDLVRLPIHYKHVDSFRILYTNRYIFQYIFQLLNSYIRHYLKSIPMSPT